MQHIFRQNYSVTTKKNDIALVKFFGSIEFNDFIRPACIRLATDEVPVTENLVIAGWGSIEAESQSLLFFLSLVVNFCFQNQISVLQERIDQKRCSKRT